MDITSSLEELAKEFISGEALNGTTNVLSSCANSVLDITNFTIAQKKSEKDISDPKNKEIHKEITKEAKNSIKNVEALYTEQELQKIFDEIYDKRKSEFGYLSEEDKNNLYITYKEFVYNYTKGVVKSMSSVETAIIRKLDNISSDINTIFNREFDKAMSDFNEKRYNYNQNNNTLFLQIVSNTFDVSHDNGKYCMLENVFTYLEGTEYNEDNAFTLTFSIKNTGMNIINKIKISNLKVYYSDIIMDDTMDNGIAVMPIANYDKERELVVNMVSGSEQKVHIILNCEPQYDDDDFMRYYYFDRLFLWFDMELCGNENEKKEVQMHISRNGEYHSIEGQYTIDDVGII